MSSVQLTVVLAQGQSNNPVKRGLEEDIATALLMEPGIQVSIVPHLYDLNEDHTGLLFLRSVQGDMVFLSWLYSRAAHWTLDSLGVKGCEGAVLLQPDDDDDDDDEDLQGAGGEDEDKSTLGAVDVPDRRIYSLDMRCSDLPEKYVEEIRRIAAELQVKTIPIQLNLDDDQGDSGSVVATGSPVSSGSVENSRPSDEQDLSRWIGGDPSAQQLARYSEPQKFLQPTGRRWNPVIDYDRCTNCMECIDFCLFGVYGVDGVDRILVEQPDNCKKGCPACSRVCPEHAIIFPMHRTPEIAGAPGTGLAGLKIDLSKLFGGGNAFEMATQERDAELVKDGRDAVGMSVGIPKRQGNNASRPKDELDGLMDQLDDLDL